MTNSMGDLLETLRRARGLTQEELCGRTGVTQAALSRYENDQRSPDDDALRRLAGALGVSPRFVERAGPVRGALAVDAHMRRQRTSKATVWRRLEARLNAYRIHAASVFEDVSMRAEQTVPVIDPIDVPPSEAALMVRAQWRMPIGPVRHLVRWLESSGCLIFAEDFGTRRIDGLSQWVGDHPVVLLNSALPTDRMRFTLAHELGHLVLHNGFASEDPESEAAEFAAEFLLPEHVIRPDLRPVTLGHLSDLKRLWGVSMQALLERAYALGVVSHNERVQLRKMMSGRGWTVNEPGSDQLAPETPELVAYIGNSLRDKGLSDDEIADITGFAPDSNENPFLPTRRHLAAV